MKMSQAAQYMRAELIGDDLSFDSISIDSRNMLSDSVFFALKGPNHDGHDYIEQATENDAVGFVVEEQATTAKPQVLVKNTRKALGELAAGWRSELTDTKIIAITGSNGKTTVKEMLLAICSEAGSAIATAGNLNNDIGMPLSLLKVKKNHQYAVIEMGANHAGEIDYLSGIAKPDIALVNNAGPAHLEGFGSLQGVAEAKGEIYTHLSPEGVAIVNYDDVFANYWLSLNEHRQVITFSLGNTDTDIVGYQRDNALVVSYQGQDIAIHLPLAGAHNLRNALAATAIAKAAGISNEDIKNGLQSVKAAPGRLNILTAASNILIDDTYNANAASFKAAIDVLKTYTNKTCLIMGDIGELGDYSAQQHAEVGSYAKKASIDLMFAYGPMSTDAVEAFGSEAFHFTDQTMLIDHIKEENFKDTVFLVKGSRSMQMDKVIDSLCQHFKKVES